MYVTLSSNSRILLVEDDSDLLQLFHDALNTSGIQVDGFTDPLKAYSQIKEVKKDVKVLLMSAFEITDDHDSELNEIQLDEFLQKPFDVQKLVSMVEKYIGQKAVTNSVQIGTRAN